MVTVITLCYNHAAYIRDCLEGVMSQQCDFQFEHLIHDDASNDESAAIIRLFEARYPERLRPIYQIENQYSKGVAIGSTYIYPRARGKYVAFCEGDDYWCDSKKLQRQVEYLEQHPECTMVYGSVQYLHEPQHALGRTWGGDAKSDFRRLIRSNCIPTPTVMIRREVVERFFREMEPEKRSWGMGDYPLWLYASTCGEVHFIDSVMAVYRILEESASHTRDLEKRYRFRCNSLRVQTDFMERFPQLLDSKSRTRAYNRAYGAIYRMALVLQKNETLEKIEGFYRRHNRPMHLYLKLFGGIVRAMQSRIYRRKGYSWRV